MGRRSGKTKEGRKEGRKGGGRKHDNVRRKNIQGVAHAKKYIKINAHNKFVQSQVYLANVPAFAQRPVLSQGRAHHLEDDRQCCQVFTKWYENTFFIECKTQWLPTENFALAKFFEDKKKPPFGNPRPCMMLMTHLQAKAGTPPSPLFFCESFARGLAWMNLILSSSCCAPSSTQCLTYPPVCSLSLSTAAAATTAAAAAATHVFRTRKNFCFAACVREKRGGGDDVICRGDERRKRDTQRFREFRTLFFWKKREGLKKNMPIFLTNLDVELLPPTLPLGRSCC